MSRTILEEGMAFRLTMGKSLGTWSQCSFAVSVGNSRLSAWLKVSTCWWWEWWGQSCRARRCAYVTSAATSTASATWCRNEATTSWSSSGETSTYLAVRSTWSFTENAVDFAMLDKWSVCQNVYGYCFGFVLRLLIALIVCLFCMYYFFVTFFGLRCAGFQVALE